VHVRRKLAAAKRDYWFDRLWRKGSKRLARHVLRAEAALTQLLPSGGPPGPNVLVDARDFLRGFPKIPRSPMGRPKLPFLPTALRDLGLEESEGRILLRACGIPLSPGRPSRP